MVLSLGNPPGCNNPGAGLRLGDASGDAALSWLAGMPCGELQVAHYGSQMLVLEGVDETRHPAREAVAARLGETAEQYGMVRLRTDRRVWG